MLRLVLILLLANPLRAQSLGQVLGWKFNHAPGIETVVHEDATEEIRAWPSSLGPVPSESDLALFRTQFIAWKDAQDQQKRIDESNVVLARWVEQLTVSLHGKTILLSSDIPAIVRNTINARRAERGQPAINW